MLGTILRLILVVLAVRMLYPLFKGIGSLFGKPSSSARAGDGKQAGRDQAGRARRDYSDLTSYEIEDADYEEIRRK